MEELIGQLGIDWRMLLAQAVNFIILLLILRFAVYHPVLKILNDRRKKIDEGLTKAEEAGKRLQEVDEIAKDKLKEAEKEASGILTKMEGDARTREMEILDKARIKEKEIMKSAELAIEGKKEEARKDLEKEAEKLVKEALIKTVELSPEKIDDAMISQAIKELK